MNTPEMMVLRLIEGVASKEDIQCLKDTGWLTPSLERLYRVELNKCKEGVNGTDYRSL
jgi:hypothetical protein